MILSDATIKKLIAERKLVIDPLGENTIQQNGVDLKIGDEIAVGKTRIDVPFIDASSSEEIRRSYEIVRGEGDLLIPSHTHLLFTTLEHIEVPNNVVGFCCLRSSLARLGFVSPPTIVDAGFKGTLTIESFYGGAIPIKIPIGARFLHVVFAFADREVENPYKGVYSGQKGVTLPKPIERERR